RQVQRGIDHRRMLPSVPAAICYASAPLPTPPTMPQNQDLATLIRAGTALITIDTAEEAAAIDAFRHVLGQVWRPLYRWSITDGLKRLDIDQDAPERSVEVAPDATQTLPAIKGE